MAQSVTIPDDFDFLPPGRTALLRYDSTQSSTKTRVTIRKNVFSFLLEGEKVAYLAGDPIRIVPGQFLLMAAGNCLMTERLSINGGYRSLLFFFDDELLQDFYQKHSALAGAGQSPVVGFEADEFISTYLRSLQLMMDATPALQEEMQLLKLEELLLYLAGKYPEQLQSLHRMDTGDKELKAAIEGNLDHSITVEELAFVCNMSLSTFKRRFSRLYGTTPNKWMLQKRMEQAALLLQGQEKPSEVYHQVGYENHSSFTESFKQVYGVTPSEFQRQRIRATASGAG
jgi:AraC-like DNA-binding protein